jgi:lipopolysaccharide transport system permease protein
LTEATLDRPLPVLELTGESTAPRVLLRDLRRAWPLLPLLARQDYVARYRSAALGLLWSVFLPLLQGAVLAVVFSHVVKVNTSGQSYPIFVFLGMNAWAFISTSWSSGATSIVDGSAIASRVYFPRLLLPAVPAAANLPALAISNAVALLAMPLFGVSFRVSLLLLPVAMLIETIFVIALSAVTTLMHVYFRDVRYLVSALLMVAFYATPVIYPLTLVHGALKAIVLANPATGIVQLARYSVFGTTRDLGWALLATLVWTVALVIIAVRSFGRHERIAVDRL